MKFYLDTANVEVIKRVARLGLVDGVTTDPSLIAKEGRDFKVIIEEISSLIPGPISAEVIAKSASDILKEAEAINEWGSNVVVRLPMTEEGLEAMHTLASQGIKTNVTLIFSVAQGLMAAKSGATYISPFVGQLDDGGNEGLKLIRDLRTVMDNYGFSTEIIASSLRTIKDVEEVAIASSHIAAIPEALIPSLWEHALTTEGIAQYTRDWGNMNGPT